MSATLRTLELRHLVRSPRGRTVLAALMIATLSSTLLGALLVRSHARTGARDQSASLERIDASASSTSTAAVTAFDLSAWSDTFIARGITAPSALVANDLAALPDSAAIRVYEPPSMVASLAERSPAAILLGALDLAWVLALLLPLAAIALGFDAFARDREKGTLAMLLAPARTGRPLILARTYANAAILWLGVVPMTLAGALVQGVITGAYPDPATLAALFVLLSGYVLMLAAIAISVSALADRSATSLAILVSGWLLFFVAVPLAIGGIVRTAYPMPDPRARLDGELAAQDVFQKPSAQILDEQAEKDRALDPSLGIDGISTQNRYYMLLSRERYHRAKAARYEEDTALSRRIELAEITLWLSPATIVANALASLARAAPRERLDFAADGERYRARLEDFVRARVAANETRFANAGDWPRFARAPDPKIGLALAAGLAFLLLASIAVLSAGAIFDRMELAPTREDA